jgi:hypothetical protein
MQTWVEIHNEVPKRRKRGSWELCFQNVTYHYADGTTDDGYRFIWRRPDNTLQPARGQARIPNAAALDKLIKEAKSDGWFR